MTEITVYYRDNKQTIAGFMIKGHTGYAAHGEDIVCSAVSTAALTAANGITEILGIPAKTESKEGYLKCMLPRIVPHDKAYAADVLLQSMILTFKNLETQYKKYIVLRRRCSR